MNKSCIQARRTWNETLPYGGLFTIWGIGNLWLYIQLEHVEVIPQQVASIWRWNIFIFIVAGLGCVIYLTLKINKLNTKMKQILDAMPCAVFLFDEEKNVECCNRLAQDLMDSGTLNECSDLKKWHISDIEIHSSRFPGVYVSGGTYLAFKEHAFDNRYGKFDGNMFVMLDITEWRKTAQNTKDMAEVLQDLNHYLVCASNSFDESIKALANSTVKQALAFQELANYVYSIANDVELDAQQIKNTLGEIGGALGEQNKTYHHNLEKLKESAKLMESSHKAAQKARTYFEALEKEYGGIQQ